MKIKIFSLMLAMILCIIPTSIMAANTSDVSDTIFVCEDYSAALTANGDLYCWGSNSLGQVGNGTKASVAKPVKVLSNVVSFKGGASNVAAITQNGDLYIWGHNDSGQMGNGQNGGDLIQLKPLKVLSNVSFVSIEKDESFTAAYYSTSMAVITKTGDLYCWGYTGGGQAGNGQSGKDVYQTTPVKVLSNVASVTSNNGAVAAITKSGDLYMWGRNTYGQVGNGQSGKDVYQTTPVKVLSNVTSINLNIDTAAAIATNGDLYCWGANWQGRVGNGSSTHQPTPVKVLSHVKFANIDTVTTALTENGDLYCWGYTEFGQVGNGKFGIDDRQTTPAKIMENVAAVSTGGTNTAAITTGGDLYCWGTNDWGQIGNGTLAQQVTPVKVLSNVASMTIGITSSATTKNGDLYCWGENGTGKVGNGKSDLSYDGIDPVGNSLVATSPIKVLGNVAAFMFSDEKSAAITKNGDLYHWGNNVSKPYKVLTGVKLPNTAPSTPGLTATPTASKVLVDGKNVSFDAYSIAGNNYFKLRDLAYVLNGSTKQFSVSWDGNNNAIALQKGNPYIPVGGEMSTKGTVAIAAVPTTAKIILGGQTVKMTAYTIGGNNYFKLRDVGIAFDFDVSWNNALQTIVIDTASAYTPD